MGKKNKDWRRHISENRNYSDERECDASKYVCVGTDTGIETDTNTRTAWYYHYYYYNSTIKQ